MSSEALEYEKVHCSGNVKLSRYIRSQSTISLAQTQHSLCCSATHSQTHLNKMLIWKIVCCCCCSSFIDLFRYIHTARSHLTEARNQTWNQKSLRVFFRMENNKFRPASAVAMDGESILSAKICWSLLSRVYYVLAHLIHSSDCDFKSILRFFDDDSSIFSSKNVFFSFVWISEAQRIQTKNIFRS